MATYLRIVARLEKSEPKEKSDDSHFIGLQDLGIPRALQLRSEARMVSVAMGAALMGTMYFYGPDVLNMAEVPVVGVWFASLYEVTGL